MNPSVAIVVPTVGRPSLDVLLAGLARQLEPVTGSIVVVDDRRHPDRDLLPRRPAGLDVVVVPGRKRGPAAARNDGWRRTRAHWVVFLDDDVVPGPTWYRRLGRDLTEAALDPAVVAVQGGVVVPLPSHRRPTDWERNVSGLESARWATADMAVRRDALVAVAGFDEAFPRAYREDADLALRLMGTGGRLVRGHRMVRHPVRDAPWHVSVRLQRGNRDDALMRRRHGPGWRQEAGAPAGAFRHHVATTTALVAAAGLALAGNTVAASAAAAAWLGCTARFAARRIAPGPRTAAEVTAMVATSVVVPPLASWHRVTGTIDAYRRPDVTTRAVLFDRDGTLIHDVPYNGDPDRVVPVEGARRAVDRLRRAGVRTGIVSNQSALARGTLTPAQVQAVNDRVGAVLGPFDVVAVCPHGPSDGCPCRKPRPGLVLRAADELGVDPRHCVVIGDIGADVGAAVAAGARAVLVPTPATLAREVAAARALPGRRVSVEASLEAACRRALGRW
jgi:HAD superfamily hydrolase (TIGR01662 family)